MKRHISQIIFKGIIVILGGSMGVFFSSVLYCDLTNYNNMPAFLVAILTMPTFLVYGLPVLTLICLLFGRYIKPDYSSVAFILGLAWPFLYFLLAATYKWLNLPKSLAFGIAVIILAHSMTALITWGYILILKMIINR